MPREPEQWLLIPAQPLKFTEGVISVDELPPNEELLGPDPTPAQLQQTRDLGAIVEPIILRARGRRDPKSKAGRDAPVVLRGRRRIKMARACEVKTIRYRMVKDCDWALGASLDLSAHATRKENYAAELAAINALLAEGLDEARIAEATGLPAATITKRLALNDLMPDLLEAYMAGRIGTGVAEAACKLAKSLQRKLAKLLKENGRLTADDVRALRRAEADDATGRLDFGTINDPNGDGGGEPPPPPAGDSRGRTAIGLVVAYLQDTATAAEDRNAFLVDLHRAIAPFMPVESLVDAVLNAAEDAAGAGTPEPLPPTKERHLRIPRVRRPAGRAR